MKICIICPNYPPKVCGIGDYTYKLARELTRSDTEVVIIANEDNEIQEEFRNVKNPKVLSTIRDWSFKNLSKLLEILKAEKPDIIHIQYQNNLYQEKQMINFLPIFLRLFSRAKIIVTLHELQHPRFISFTDIFSKFNMFTLLFFSHKIISTSEMQLVRIPALFDLKAKSTVIPVGSNIDFSPISREDRLAYRKKIGVGEDETLLVNFGMIRPDKGIEALFKAMSGIVEAGYKAKLVLAGARPAGYWDEYRYKVFKAIRDLNIQDYVSDLGFLEQGELSCLLSSADVSVLPYVEGISTKRGTLAASILHGLPVITTVNKHLPEFLKEAETIILFEPDNVQQLRDRIINFIASGRSRAGIKNPSGGLSSYLSWEGIWRSHLELYKAATKRKILVVAMGFAPRIGGAEKTSYEMCRNFQFVKPVVITSKEDKTEDFDKMQNFKIYRFLKAKKGLFRLIFFSLYSLFIAAKEKPKIVFSSNILHDAYCALLIKKIYNVPFCAYIYDMHDLLYLIKKERFKQQLLRMNIRNADYLFTNSEFTKSLIERYIGQRQISVLYPGIDTEKYFPEVDRSEIVRKYNLAGRRVLLSVCRLVEHKGLDKVLEALDLIKNEFRDIIYLIIGKGQDKPRLGGLIKKYRLQNNVLIFESVSDDELPKYYAACDVFIMPSRKTKSGFIFEGFGISFLEAAACGKPCIGGKTGGVGEAVIDGRTGILVDPEDVNEIAAGITRLLNSEKLRREMGQAGRERAEEEFAWINFSKKIENCLRV